MNRKGIAIWLALVVLLSSIIIVVKIAPKATAYTPHAPIHIDGDADFAIQAAREGWPGDGTEGNPYVIEGYEISSSSHYGIDISSTNVHFVIKDNKINSGSWSSTGIFLNSVENGKISDCIFENHSNGIYLWAANKIIITNNRLINNNLLFWESIECTFIANTFIEGGFKVQGFELERWNSHNIDTSNTVNGKPVYYWKDRNGGTVPEDAGQIILVNCTDVTVENQKLTNGSHGIILGYSSIINIKWNLIDSNNEAGIYLWKSSENTITDNNLSSNKVGTELQHSNNNTIQFNEVSNGGTGIFILDPSTGNYVFGNNALNNSIGIKIFSSPSISNEQYLSHGNTIKNNTVTDNWGGISIVHSKWNEIIDNTVANNYVRGISLDESDENTIRNNIVSNSSRGFFISSSNENSLLDNNVSSNYFGIFLEHSYDNIIHHNNIINNSVQLYQNDSINSWDDGEGEGNYWSDYAGMDL
ncbi:MAG: right-handed parallel beta-helix repeat-containing protein, partial [Thermoplasmata archaeon]